MSKIPESVWAKYPNAELWTAEAIEQLRLRARPGTVEITEADARVILGMSEVCDCEGIGPDDTDLKKRLIAAFPNIKRGVY